MSESGIDPLEQHAAERWGEVFEAASMAEITDALAVVRFVRERLAEANGYGLEGVDPAGGLESDATTAEWLDAG